MQLHLKEFLENQHLLQMACAGKDVMPRICNVYFVSDEAGSLYFLSEVDTKHSQIISSFPNIAFAIAWFNPHDFDDRKGIQGTGICMQIDFDEEIIRKYCEMYKRSFEDTKKYMLENPGLALYKITPQFMKYWDDKILGEEGTEEFTL